ncbi:Short-chain dehydrogenase/reductase SDR [Penicillium frequentans]|uniref:Short-chain dehydrogenase/reductase SDR n=1 Tax=Penicillium frequentans TaxID=3151616 RepID=A0AAD6CZP4_9EURO|nr:Short-chain dehydrogenase/reductase SDR [Penicillium glabrum]
MSHLQASELFSVKDRVVVITGGGSGLGRIITRSLAVNGVSKIFILGRREDALHETAAQAPEGIVIPVQCDVTSKDSLEAAYQAVAAQTTHVDILFANSGIMGPMMRSPQPKADGSLPSITEIRDELYNIPMADFTNVMNVNVTGAYYTVLAFLPLLEAANKRRAAPQQGVMSPPTAQVVITGSLAGFNRKPPFSYAYNVSKAGVHHLVKMLSTTFTSYDIRFNGISPGLYYSEMAEHVFDTEGIKGTGISDGSFPREMIPLTRGGAEQDMAGLVVWMASASGGYLNGTIIVTDGGRLAQVPATY